MNAKNIQHKNKNANFELEAQIFWAGRNPESPVFVQIHLIWFNKIIKSVSQPKVEKDIYIYIYIYIT